VSEKEKQFLNVVVPVELLSRLDDFRFEHRFESRAEAIRHLLEWALNNYEGGHNNG